MKDYNNKDDDATVVGGEVRLVNGVAQFDPIMGVGDGTVPEWSARNGGTDGILDTVRAVHDKIFDDQDVMKLLERKIANVAGAIGIGIDLKNEEKIDGVVIQRYIKRYSEAGLSGLDPDTYSNVVNDLATVAKGSAVDPNLLFQSYQARGADDAVRALGLAVAAKSGGLNEAQDAYSWNASAELNFKLDNPGVAWSISQDGIAAVGSNSPEEIVQRALRNMKSISGKSRLLMGAYGGFSDLQDAGKLGSFAAQKHIGQFEMLIGAETIFMDTATMPRLLQPG